MERELAKISVILSFYNEQSVLPELLQRMREVFASLIESNIVKSYELVFVNDNSTDESEKYLRAELEKGDIVIINMSRNFGVSECVMAGMEYATGDVLIYMDADLQDPPEVIPKLLEANPADKPTQIRIMFLQLK